MDHNIPCSTRELCPLEHASTAIQSFDTVRALHQSVLCLRAALENAHKEIDTLKKQISVQTDVKDGKIFRENLEENLGQNKSEDKTTADADGKESELHKATVKIAADERKTDETTDDQSLKTKRKTRRDYHKSEKRTEKYDFTKSTFVPDITIVTNPNPSTSNKSRKQMASKIDVKIKLTSNVNVDSTSSGTADESNSNSGKWTKFVCPRLAFNYCYFKGSDTARDSEQADEQEENSDSLNTTEQIQNASTNTEEVVDFAEERTTETNFEIKQSEDITAEEHTKNVTKLTRSLRHTSTTSSEANEEVDDIELIFSSDDKEHLQEDLVSISDAEPWEKAGSTGTPVLVNFNTLSSSEDLHSKSKKKESGDIIMETDQEGPENRTDMKRDESVDTFEQVGPIIWTKSSATSDVKKTVFYFRSKTQRDWVDDGRTTMF